MISRYDYEQQERRTQEALHAIDYRLQLHNQVHDDEQAWQDWVHGDGPRPEQ